MKKMILISALVVAALAMAAVGVGVAFAQEGTPPAFSGQGPMRNGDGPLHTFMVIEFAKRLDLNVNDINTRLAAGETMYDIALSAGVTAEEFPAIMTEVRTAAVTASVAANVITQEQADWMLSHGFGQGGMHGNGNEDGDCDGTSTQQQNGQHGQGMMNGAHNGAQNQQNNP